jgi:hypothetical protein
MPKGAKIIRIDGFDGALWVWAIVETDSELERRNFDLYKTGGEMPDDILEYTYHGCGAIFIQMELMMYVFERKDSATQAEPLPAPFDWKSVQENSDVR